jgi:hypothetical protein
MNDFELDTEAGYKPPGGGVSLLGFLRWFLVFAAFFIALWMMYDRLGGENAKILTRLAFSGLFMVWGVRIILHPEQHEDVITDRERHGARVNGIVLVVVASAVATIAVQNYLYSE